MQIIDGTGRGYQAKVDDGNRLLTATVTEATIANASADGRSFSAGTPFLTITTTEGHMIYYANNCGVDAVVSKLYVNWNGGSSNYDRPCYMTWYREPSAPSANNTTSALLNLNLGSGNTASDCVVEYWDEVSTGMTISSAGTPGGFCIFGPGQTTMDINDSIIIPNGSAMSLAFKGEEAGELSVIMSMSYRAS